MSIPEISQQQEAFAVNEDLILVGAEAKSRDEILARLAQLLKEKGYVKESYFPALLEREAVFPTGLPTQVTGVAIPHTDNSHVLHPAIAVATLAKPVTFQAMDNPANGIDVEIVIMLAVKNPGAQLQMLQKIMSILQSPEILTGLKEAKDVQEVKDVVLNHLAS